MNRITCLVAAFFCVLSMADFKILQDSYEFRQLVKDSQVPVVVQFSAAWCGPCQSLKKVFTTVAKDYSDDQVILAYVDADINKDLKQYLQGGYPTTRTFVNGELAAKKFVGSQSESYVRNFIETVLANRDAESNFCAL